MSTRVDIIMTIKRPNAKALSVYNSQRNIAQFGLCIYLYYFYCLFWFLCENLRHLYSDL